MRPLSPQEGPWLAARWNEACPPRFELEPETILRLTLGSGLFEPRASFASEEGWVAAKWSAHGRLFEGPHPQRLHLTLATHPSMLAPAVEAARSLGASSVSLGADLDHILPGLPRVEGWELGKELEREMLALGFVRPEALVVDIERDLAGYEPYEGCLEPLEKEGIECRTAVLSDRDAMTAFFAETFPGRWQHDVMRKFDSGEGHQIDLLCDSAGEVLGFSSTQNPQTQAPICGGVWKKSLGENWAALGPIGISSKVRGKGLGGALLGASLQRLAKEGARQTIIDWTSLVEFYGMHGFSVARQYDYWTLDLTP